MRGQVFQALEDEFQVGPVDLDGDLHRAAVRVVAAVVDAVVPVDDVGRAELTEPAVQRGEGEQAVLAIVGRADHLGAAFEQLGHVWLVAHADGVAEQEGSG